MSNLGRGLAVVALTIGVSAGARPAAAGTPPSPSEHLGFTLGADRTLADYHQIVDYLKVLAEASARVELQVLGQTTLGEEMVMAVISSEPNIAKLGRIREIARHLADPRGLGEEQAESLVAEGKLVLLVTCNIHSTVKPQHRAQTPVTFPMLFGSLYWSTSG